jgi:predicted  nucleic acid-binding Zn-ribbon protein
VPDEVIPPGGRDVQCSNCGDTWFQQHPEGAPGLKDEAAVPAAAQDTPEHPEPETAEMSAGETEEYTDESVWGDEEEPEPAPPQRPSVDPVVADILRQEAAREQVARAAQAAAGIETQPDLGLRPPSHEEDERSRQARARIERLRGTPAASGAEEQGGADQHAAIDPSSRRNLLPDIEEINSSLTAFDLPEEPEEPAFAEEPEAPIQRSGFRSGFRLAVLIFLLGTTIYLLAPMIANQIPAAEAPLAQYVQAVDAARLWLDTKVSAAMGWVTEAASPAAGEGN